MADYSAGIARQDGLVTAIKDMAVGAVLFGVVGLFVTKVFGWTDSKQLIAVGAFVLLGVLVPWFVWRRFSARAKRRADEAEAKRVELMRLFDEQGPQYMRRHTGIVRTYDKLLDCKADMLEDLERATDIRLLLQIGRWELGAGEPAFFSTLLREKKSGSTVRILRASDKSPFLSKERAENRRYNYEHWVESVRRLSAEIKSLRNSEAKIEDRQHDEPYLWRIFIFAPVAYVSPYIHSHENHTKAIVYKIEEGPGSLYAVFKNYFDYVWMKNDPAGPADPNLRWANWE